jgi:ubiquinone/menaquinone biosynthesis C-methylase UbiE
LKIGNSIATEFDEFSVNYTRDMVQCVPNYLKLIDAFAAALPSNFIPERILDLGCGNGNVTQYLLKVFPNAHFTLLDASPEMIGLCKKRFATHNFDYQTAYFHEYDFPKAGFDMITAGFSLHHCDSEAKKLLFGKIHEGLRAGGIFGYSDLMIAKESSQHESFLKIWETFVQKSYPDGEKWQWLMAHYAQFDKPNGLAEQLDWLLKTGFGTIEPVINELYWVHIRAVK